MRISDSTALVKKLRFDIAGWASLVIAFNMLPWAPVYGFSALLLSAVWFLFSVAFFRLKRSDDELRYNGSEDG